METDKGNNVQEKVGTKASKKRVNTKKSKVHHARMESKHSEKTSEQTVFSGGIVLVLALLVGFLFYNQIQLFELATLAGISSGAPAVLQNIVSGGAKTSLSFSDSDKVTYAPVLLAQGEQPAIAGYGTKVKELPTITSSPKKTKTGDAVQDTLNLIVPTGTPEYGQELGVSFDDPINAQQKLGQLQNTINLDATQEQRWQRIVGSFTCDYCCGSPQQPTRISHCGCAHAAAWRGLARFLVQKYGNKVSDEQILGQLSKWKALWYPGPTVQRILQEKTLSEGHNQNRAPVKLDQLPQMVGGC